MAVDSGYAAWLKTTARFVGATIAGASAAWGDKALDSSVVTPLAVKADAQTEATNQALFLAGPTVRDKILVTGLRRDLIGRVVTITGDRLGYEGAGAVVLVLGAQESETIKTTILTVLKRL